MKKLRILIGRHFGFEAKNNASMLLDNLLPILQKTFEVSIIWFLYMPEKQKLVPPHEYERTVDIHDFNNAVELLKEVKPNLVFDNDFPSLMDFALDSAAKHLNIPVVTKIISSDQEKTTTKQFFTSFLPMFFQNSLPFEQNEKKQFLRRGRFFLYKYWFYLKTLKAINYNLLKIIKYFFIVLKWHTSSEIPYLDPRFQNKLQFLESEQMLKPMIGKGFDPSTLVVTGNPLYDGAFKKFRKLENKPSSTNKIRILFPPIQLYEGGIWTKKQRNFTIKEIIKNICTHKDKFSLIIKLHPSSQVYKDYESIIHEIDPDIPIYQKGTIENFLGDIDVVVSFGAIYSSLLFSLIAKKPLILCNFINYTPETPIDDKAAWECTRPPELPKIIENAYSNRFQNQKKVDEYLKKIMYKTDGFASERLCEAISRLLANIEK